MASGRSRWFTWGMLVAGVVLAGAGSARADVIIATEVRPTTVSAFGGLVVWSSAVPSTGQYVLRSWNGTSVETLPIAARDAPFDADLGPDRQGRPVAVYSRCTIEQPLATGPFPDYGDGRGCDLFRYRFDSRREERLRSLSSSSHDEFTPTIWGTRVAFARRVANAERLYIATLGGRRPSRRIPGGSDPFKPGLCANQARPSRLDLRASRLVFGWDDVCGLGFGCPSQRGGVTPSAGELWDVSTQPKGSRRRLQSVCSTGPGQLFASPALTENTLYYLAHGSAIEGNIFRVRRRRGRNTTDLRAPLGSSALSADGSRLVVSQDVGPDTFNIVVLGQGSQT